MYGPLALSGSAFSVSSSRSGCRSARRIRRLYSASGLSRRGVQDRSGAELSGERPTLLLQSWRPRSGGRLSDCPRTSPPRFAGEVLAQAATSPCGEGFAPISRSLARSTAGASSEAPSFSVWTRSSSPSIVSRSAISVTASRALVPHDCSQPASIIPAAVITARDCDSSDRPLILVSPASLSQLRQRLCRSVQCSSCHTPWKSAGLTWVSLPVHPVPAPDALAEAAAGCVRMVHSQQRIEAVASLSSASAAPVSSCARAVRAPGGSFCEAPRSVTAGCLAVVSDCHCEHS